MSEIVKDAPFEQRDDDSLEPRKLTDFERFHVVSDEGKFRPQSSRELNLALGAVEHRESVGGFAKYLNEVLIHQIHSTSEDPQAALRKIISEIKSFAKASKTELYLMTMLKNELPDSAVAGMRQSSNLKDWKHQGTTRRSLKQLALTRRQLTYREDTDKVDLDPVSDEEVQSLLARTRRHEADALIAITEDSLKNRYEFWSDALRSSRSHLVARPIAQSALNELEK